MNTVDRIRTFLNEVKIETKKITWPTPQELKESTTVVIIAVVLITVFIAIIDLILNNALSFVIRLGG
ncbi:MAG: preprotein translocase subunit SecE [Candidatus Eisenbacteria sp.]|nr:preprotein translocase subunit SecE [Candidatus Eisenbacteria bacterium]